MRQTTSRSRLPYYYRLGYTLVMTLIYVGMGLYFIIYARGREEMQTGLVPEWVLTLCGVVLILYGALRMVRTIRFRRPQA